MLASFSMDSLKGKGEPNQYTMYCCAALTAPSSMTPHMQTGDIMVSINGVSLISDSDQAELKGGMDAFFEVITAAIKNAKSPRKVRLLRPMRLKALTSASKQAAYEISLSELESSLLFDANFRTHIPKFTVGKMPMGKIFEPATASLFDVIFPFQQSLGIRIYPYKLVNIHSFPRLLKGTPQKPILGIRQNNLMDDMLDDESFEDFNETLNDSYAEFNDETKEADIDAFEYDIMATVNDCLQLLDSGKTPKKFLHEVENKEQFSIMDGMGDDYIDPQQDILNKLGKAISEAPSKLRSVHCLDDDIISDRGRIAVGTHVSRLEATGDDFIPASSPLGGQIATSFDENDVEIEIEDVSSPTSSKAVGNMVSRFESTSSQSSRRGSCRVSPIKRVVVNLQDFIPSSSDSSPHPIPKHSEQNTTQNSQNSMATLPTRSLSLDKKKSLSDTKFMTENGKVAEHLVKSISPIRNRVEKTFLELSPTRNFPISSDLSPDKLNDSTTERIVLKAVAKFKSNLNVVTCENQQLKAKMDFFKKSVSIEKQLLNFELKGVKAKLQSSEVELEDAIIESKMNAIILQDELEQNMTGVVSTILGEKEMLQKELKKTKDFLLEMEIKFANQLTETLEESDSIRSELEVRTNENTALTAIVLNLQIAKETAESSAAMTDFRIKTAAKAHAKEILILKESNKKTRSQVMSFITDFDSTILPSACTEKTIEAFLNGRGVAINKKRRKVFQALQEDNNKLNDDLDVLQELLDVETQLHMTRVELYSKAVIENSQLSSNKNCSSTLSSPGKTRSSCVKLLFNNEIKEEKMAWNTGGKSTKSRPLNKTQNEKKRNNSLVPREIIPQSVIGPGTSKPVPEEETSKVRNFNTLKRLIPSSGKTSDVSNYESTFDSPGGLTSTESSGSARMRKDLTETDKENKNLKNLDINKCSDYGLGVGISDPSHSPALSSNSSTNSLRSASLGSPTLMSITPRKKNIVISTTRNDKLENSLRKDFRSPGHKVPVGFGFGSSTSRNSASLKGSRRHSDNHQPIVTLSGDTYTYTSDVTVADSF